MQIDDAPSNSPSNTGLIPTHRGITMRFAERTRKQIIKMLEERGLEWRVDKYGDLLYLDVFQDMAMWVQAPVTNKQVGEFLDSYQEV